MNFKKNWVFLQLKFEKHCSTRWLTLGPACNRILEQMPVLKEYYLKFIAIKNSKTAKKQSYLDIVKYLQNPYIEPILHFTSYAAEILTKNLTLLMQKNQPLIHILYPQLSKVVMIMLSNFIVKEVENVVETESDNIKKKSDKKSNKASSKKKSNKFELNQTVFDKNQVLDIIEDESKALPLLEINCGEKAKESLSKMT